MHDILIYKNLIIKRKALINKQTRSNWNDKSGAVPEYLTSSQSSECYTATHVWLLTPATARLTLLPFKNKISLQKTNNFNILRLSGKWCTMYIHILISHLLQKVYLRRYGCPSRLVFFTRSSICPTQESHILFCIDKAHKRSFTKVALNSVLEENAIDFAWEFCWNFCRIFILEFNFFFFLQTVYICCFSQLSHRRFSPVQFVCLLRAVQCVLCALCAKKQVRGFCVFARTMGLWPYNRELIMII